MTGGGVTGLVSGTPWADVGATDTGALYLWKGPISAAGTEDVLLSVPGAVANDYLLR